MSEDASEGAKRADLLPCPFCGAPGEYDSRRWQPGAQGGPGYVGNAVYCSSMDCQADTGIHDTEEEAMAAWNRRAEPPIPKWVDTEDFKNATLAAVDAPMQTADPVRPKSWFSLDLETPTPVHAGHDEVVDQPGQGDPPLITLSTRLPGSDPIAAVYRMGADEAGALIWSFEHNGWWAPGRQGYVSDVDAAGRYFLAEARQIVEIANIAAINEAIVLLPRNRVPAQRPTGSKEDRRSCQSGTQPTKRLNWRGLKPPSRLASR